MTGATGEWEVVYWAADMVEAELVRALLATSGLMVRLEGETLGTLYGLHTGPLAQVRVLVPRGMEREAKAIIEASPEFTGDE